MLVVTRTITQELLLCRLNIVLLEKRSAHLESKSTAISRPQVITELTRHLAPPLGHTIKAQHILDEVKELSIRTRRTEHNYGYREVHRSRLFEPRLANATVVLTAHGSTVRILKTNG